MKRDQVDPGLLATINRTVNENIGVNDPKTDHLHSKVEHHLNHYYAHLNIVNAYQGIGDRDNMDKHLQIASDHHSEANAHHKELARTSIASDFSHYKSAARKRQGWVEK